MSKLPVLSGRDLVKLLGKAGYVPIRQKGSHIILSRTFDGKTKGLVVPDHREIDKGTLVEIIRQAGLTRDEFFKLL
jgi:predicted RNA binding protein YcfA (HicA-like mRNA interferase family)